MKVQSKKSKMFYYQIVNRIDDMSDDILSQLNNSLISSEVFALQLDESTDIQGKAQLLANIRYIENNCIQENFLFYREIQAHTTGEQIYNETATFLRKKSWNGVTL